MIFHGSCIGVAVKKNGAVRANPSESAPIGVQVFQITFTKALCCFRGQMQLVPQLRLLQAAKIRIQDTGNDAQTRHQHGNCH